MKAFEELQNWIDEAKAQLYQTGGIHYKDGRHYSIKYIKVSVPVEFERLDARGQSPQGWFCPIGISCTS